MLYEVITDPPAVDHAVIEQEEAEACVVAQGGGEAAAADLRSVGRFQPPGRVGLHAEG